MTKEELALILDKHKKWLNDDPDGKRADLRGADMRAANLSGADLRGANLDFSCLPPSGFPLKRVIASCLLFLFMCPPCAIPPHVLQFRGRTKPRRS